MSAFSDRIRSQRKGFFRVSDFEGGEKTLTVSHLDEGLMVFGEAKDVLNFQETGQQLQLNQTTAEWLIDNLGDDPEAWPGKKVTLFLAEYEYNKEKKRGIRLRLPGMQTAVIADEQQQRGDGQARVHPAMDDEIPF